MGMSRPEIGLWYAARRRSKKKKRNGDRPLEDGNSFFSRTVILRKIGFSCYGGYLKSDLWVRVRTSVFAVRGSGCFICSNKAEVVHHYNYSSETLLGTSLDHLYPLCKDCHDVIEFAKSGKKRMVKEAQMIFKAMVTSSSSIPGPA